jgi:hypothetical protein
VFLLQALVKPGAQDPFRKRRVPLVDQTIVAKHFGRPSTSAGDMAYAAPGRPSVTTPPLRSSYSSPMAMTPFSRRPANDFFDSLPGLSFMPAYPLSATAS